MQEKVKSGMDVKPFIDSVSDIAHLPRHQQFVVLENAWAEGLKQPGMSLLNQCKYAVSVIVVLALAGVLFLLFGYGSWLPLVALITGLVVSKIAVAKIERTILSRGLAVIEIP